MITITMTELRRHTGKCLDLCQYEDILITRRGVAVCRLQGRMEEADKAKLASKETLLRAIQGTPR